MEHKRKSSWDSKVRLEYVAHFPFVVLHAFFIISSRY